jgi:putative acetyltransferase
MEILIRTATPADAEDMALVHTDSIRKLNAPFYSPKQIEVWSGGKTKAESLAKAMGSGSESMFVATWDSQVVGWGAIGGNEIRAVYLSPDYTGRGLGRRLCTALEICAATNGFRSAHLMSSLQAYPFYLKMGYRKVAESTYRLNAEVHLEAIQMEKSLL